jgi:putative ABC transport system permease protein
MKQPQSRLPKLGDWILRLLARYDVNPHLRGDFDEEFSLVYETGGFFRAWFWYWTHLLRSLPVFIKDILYWRFVMFKNYLKFAIRNIIKHKGCSFINILGLSVGLACFMLIMLFVQHELSVDKHHKNPDRIYRVQGANGRQLSTAPAVGKWIAENIIEAEKVVRFKFRHDYLVKYRPHNDRTRERTIIVRDFGWSDPTVFDVFSFPAISGDTGTALDDPFALVLTESVAQRLFGSENPIGKTLEVNNRFEYHVTAVIEDLKRTHLRFDVLAPFENLGKIIGQSELDSFDSWNLATFVLLSENHDTTAVASKITDLFHDRLKELWNIDFVFALFPLEDIFFSDWSSFRNHGSRPLVFVFMAVAVFILLIACVNFLNLSTARASLRAKEVGIKKVVGSTRKSLIIQFLGESVLFSLISFVAAVGLVSLFLPEFNRLMQRNLAMNYFAYPLILLVFFAIAVLVGILAGIYPAFYLSAFRPVSVLKGQSTKGIRSGIFRKFLISFQFTVSIILIIATLVVLKQIQYIRNKDLGFQKEHIVYMEIPRNKDIRDNKQAFKNRLMQHPLIRNVTYSQGRPGLVYNWEGFEYQGERNGYAIFTVDPDYVDVYGLEILAGRNFSREKSTDPYRTCLLNETAVRQLGLEKPVGTILRHDDLGGSSFPVKDIEVIGVVRDFHYQTLQFEIQPMMFGWNDPWLWMISVKIAAERVPETLAHIEKTWKEFSPGFPFDYHFIDELVDSQYKNEERLAKTIGYFAVLGIFIACLGLFGLASFLAEQRTKEIGVRKVLGASVGRILMLQSKEFSRWVLAGNVVAWPLGYYAMNLWLADFAYRTDISVWSFLTAAVLALSIALLAVGYQSIRAATANPVDSLRYE